VERGLEVQYFYYSSSASNRSQAQFFLYIYILNNNYTDKTQCKIKKTKINQKISNEIEKIKISRAQFSKYFTPRFSLANFYEIELTQVKAGFPFSILQDDQNFYFVV